MKYTVHWLQELYNKGEYFKYVFFWGHTNTQREAVGKFVFSQWFESAFEVDGVVYRTAEHWMMVKKALLFNDAVITKKIMNAKTPGAAKDLGRRVKNFNEELWCQQRYNFVVTGNLHKFSQNKTLREYLLNTADRILVEASPVDFIWGIGLPQDAKHVENPETWKGLNLLGFALMEVRDLLRER